MSKKLVAYFSASGVTAKVAAKLGEGKRFSGMVSEKELSNWAAKF